MDDPLAGLQAALAGRYRLEGQVGKGGMGIVYLAHDLKHGRAVAIKVLRPEVAAALGPERFLREIGIAAQLSHPHIVPLHDSGEADGHLYYVMPFVPGETLRERLERDGPLPRDEALRITRQVATALAHAHAHGVVHRDIKPSNILLSEGFALVADFGLARALSRASEGVDISSVGLPIGTPRYMSPEQAMGSPNLDGRSDLYALGRVMDEMLRGLPEREAKREPGAGPPVDPSATVQAAIARCLSVRPADRYASADELIAALGGTEPLPIDRRWLKLAAALLLFALGGWILWRVGAVALLRSGAPALDTTRFAVLPFERLPGAPQLQADLPVRAALARWNGISVVPGVQIREALKGRRADSLDRGSARRIALQLGAGRFVRGQVVPFGDSVQLEAVLFDSRQGTPLIEKSVRLPRDFAGLESAVPSLVDSLLFRGAMPVERFPAPQGTSSIPAMHDFIKGRAAVAAWDLTAADSGFSRALSLDPGFARAALWLAQVRMWQGQPAVTWRAAAAQAALAGITQLGSRDTALAEVVAEVSRGELGTACQRWMGLTTQWPDEFPVWYGAATCLSRDGAVERDPRSPTRWKFRTSYQEVQRAWRRAFVLLPAIYRDFRASDLRSTQWLLWTAPNRARIGRAVPPDTGLFLSYPTWGGDTLAFLPRRLADFSSARAARPQATREAVTRQRLAFYDLATEWASAAPRSLEAREAVALALWSLGNPAAIDSIRATRGVARTPQDRVRLAVSAVLMLILRGVNNPNDLATARAIVDSTLTQSPELAQVDPWDLATLAALTGRAAPAARLVRSASPRMTWRLPPALSGDALALLTFAALGGPIDSLLVLEGRVRDGIATGMEATKQSLARREWLGRPVALVALDVSLPSLGQLAGSGDYLIDALAAYAKGDHATVRLLLRRAEASRSWSQATDLDFEAILPEARLLVAIGDRQEALGRLDPTLSDLGHFSLQLVSNPVGAALLVRAMAFRADLANAAGDSVNARRWGAAVAALWSGSDPFLTPVVQRMQGFVARGTH